MNSIQYSNIQVLSWLLSQHFSSIHFNVTNFETEEKMGYLKDIFENLRSEIKVEVVLRKKKCKQNIKNRRDIFFSNFSFYFESAS